MKPSKPRFFTPLSAVQIKALCVLASQAYKVAKSRGAVDELSADDYRKAGQMEAAGVGSLKDARQNHFLLIRGKWFVVIGRLDEAFYDFLNAGDQAEATRQMKWRLMGQMQELAEGIKARHLRETQIELEAAECARQAWAYAEALSVGKNHGRKIRDLDSDELEQLGFTCTNRGNAMRQVGNSANRNKSQARRPVRRDDVEAEISPGERPEPRPSDGGGLSLMQAAKARLGEARAN